MINANKTRIHTPRATHIQPTTTGNGNQVGLPEVKIKCRIYLARRTRWSARPQRQTVNQYAVAR